MHLTGERMINIHLRISCATARCYFAIIEELAFIARVVVVVAASLEYRAMMESHVEVRPIQFL